MSSPPKDMPGGQLAPLFPLPNVVLFPGAILPLHIFEPRYKQMTADALDGDCLIAMALLRAGWEKEYYGTAEIEPVVCVGKIVAHERLEDGKYNLLLQGRWRATVIDEFKAGDNTPYRMASLRQLAEQTPLEIDLTDERRRLTKLFDESALGAGGLGRQFTRLLAGPMLTSDIADLLAYNFIEDPQLKQSLLAEPDVRKRVTIVVQLLHQSRPPTSQPPDHNASLN